MIQGVNTENTAIAKTVHSKPWRTIVENRSLAF